MSKHFDDLKTSLREVNSILTGEKDAPRETIFENHLLVQIREEGKTVWTLDDAVAELRETDLSDVSTPAAFFQAVRRILNQSQSSMAHIYAEYRFAPTSGGNKTNESIRELLQKHL